MRIWDVPPERLCSRHLLGEHAELHAVWSILTAGKQGYSRHPETLRWKGKEKALFLKHDEIVAEMKARGFEHHSPLDADLATGSEIQDALVDSLEDQVELLRLKGCDCA